MFYTGHSDGSITLYNLEPMDNDPYAGLRHTGLSITNLIEDAKNRTKEHSGPIIAMDSCPEQQVMVTCRYIKLLGSRLESAVSCDFGK